MAKYTDRQTNELTYIWNLSEPLIKYNHSQRVDCRPKLRINKQKLLIHLSNFFQLLTCYCFQQSMSAIWYAKTPIKGIMLGIMLCSWKQWLHWLRHCCLSCCRWFSRVDNSGKKWLLGLTYGNDWYAKGAKTDI